MLEWIRKTTRCILEEKKKNMIQTNFESTAKISSAVLLTKRQQSLSVLENIPVYTKLKAQKSQVSHLWTAPSHCKSQTSASPWYILSWWDANGTPISLCGVIHLILCGCFGAHLCTRTPCPQNWLQNVRKCYANTWCWCNRGVPAVKWGQF